jgi:hypothetical protein
VRMTKEREAKREQVENVMGSLARAKKLLELVTLRAEQAERQLPALMTPAVSDLMEVKRTLKSAQLELSNIWNDKFWD